MVRPLEKATFSNGLFSYALLPVDPKELRFYVSLLLWATRKEHEANLYMGIMP